MTRTPNYKKWQEIFIDSKKDMTWDELVKKHRTSKRTISKALNFFKNIEKGNVNNVPDTDFQLTLACKKINELEEKIKQMKSKNPHITLIKDDPTEYEDIEIDKTQQIIQIVESLLNTTRLRLLIILYIYNELSLSRISNKLNISKSTATRHLKALKKTGLIKIREVKVRGPRFKQYFSATPEIIEMTRLSRSILRKVTPERALEACLKDVKVDSMLFSIIKNILNNVISYYREFQKKIEEIQPTKHQTIEKLFSTENICRYYLWMFDKEQYEIFRVKYRNFFNELQEDLDKLKKREETEEALEKYFLVWHMLIPIKKVFDS